MHYSIFSDADTMNLSHALSKKLLSKNCYIKTVIKPVENNPVKYVPGEICLGGQSFFANTIVQAGRSRVIV